MLFNILGSPLWLGCILLRYCEFVGVTADSCPMLKFQSGLCREEIIIHLGGRKDAKKALFQEQAKKAHRKIF